MHGVDERGQCVVQKRLRRKQVLIFFAQVSPCLIGMEPCAGAHYWARKLQGQGHSVKLMAPQFVKPYVKSNKTDVADAEAICEDGYPSQYAFCANQAGGSTSGVVSASSPTGFCQSEDSAGEPDTGLARRIRYYRATRHKLCCPTHTGNH